MKYCPGVPRCAPRGLRTHICQVPRTQATTKAENATQKWARQSRSALRTGSPPVLIWFEFVLGQHLNGGPHLAVTKAALLMTGHQQIAGTGELGMHLRDKARHYHGVHVGACDQKAMDYIRRGEAHRNAPSL